MPDLLAQSAAWLSQQRHQHLSHAVTYRREGQTVDINASIGRTVFRDENGYGTVTNSVSRDYLVQADVLVLDGLLITPAPGDQVLETFGERVLIHEVMSPTIDDPAWRYSDEHRHTLRIHTKHVGEEEINP